MSERVSVVEAAKEIGCAPGFLRLKMKTGEWDWGRTRSRRGAARTLAIMCSGQSWIGSWGRETGMNRMRHTSRGCVERSVESDGKGA